MSLDGLTLLPPSVRDAAYDNSAAVSDSAEQLATFEARSQAMVRNAPGQLDVRYAAAERQVFDYFSGDAGAPTLLFIHGGYWQMRHKNTFRFVVEGALAQGLHAALIGYSLAPQANLTRIVGEVRQGIAAVRDFAVKQHGASGDILLCGWSAGGHLTAMGLECDGVAAGLGVSGIYELEPLVDTYLNRALQLTRHEVQTLSPLRRAVTQKPFVTAFGTAELAQLQAQSRVFAAHRNQAPGELLSLDGANHFSILNSLADSQGLLLKRFLSYMP